LIRRPLVVLILPGPLLAARDDDIAVTGGLETLDQDGDMPGGNKRNRGGQDRELWDRRVHALDKVDGRRLDTALFFTFDRLDGPDFTAMMDNADERPVIDFFVAGDLEGDALPDQGEEPRLQHGFPFRI
jgi:hypothetical protein